MTKNKTNDIIKFTKNNYKLDTYGKMRKGRTKNSWYEQVETSRRDRRSGSSSADE
jgi:hypothetical protein